MKKVRLLATVVIVIIMCLMMSTVYVRGLSTNEELLKSDEQDVRNFISGDSGREEFVPAKSLEEQLEDILNNPYISRSNKAQAVEIVELSRSMETTILGGDVRRTDNAQRHYELFDRTRYRPVPGFKQQNSYYCGPATLKQTMHSMFGRSLPQDSYALALRTTTSGTNGLRIVDYINIHGTKPYMVYGVGSNSSILVNATRLKAWLFIHLMEGGGSPILRIRNASGAGEWGYRIPTGHFLNLTGYISAADYTGDPKNIDKFQVTDPAAFWEKTKQINYVSAAAVYNGLNTHPQKHFYA